MDISNQALPTLVQKCININIQYIYRDDNLCICLVLVIKFECMQPNATDNALMCDK